MPQLIHWSDEARADLRALGPEDALHILKNVARFVETGSGDVAQSHGFEPPHDLSLGRVGV